MKRVGRGVLAVVLLVASCVIAAYAQPATGGGNNAGRCSPERDARRGSRVETLTVGDLEREYRLTIPRTYDGREPAPLVVNLHGFGGTMQSQDRSTQLPRLGGRRGYIVATPQGLPINIPEEGVVENADPERAQSFEGTSWWNFFGGGSVGFEQGEAPSSDASQLGADDVAFIDALVTALSDELCVDARRVYATGMSNGAGMSTTLGCELGETFAAIAPVAGVNLSGVCRGQERVSVLAIHGDADQAVLYEGNGLLGFQLGNPSVPDRMQAWAEYDSCRPQPKRTQPVEGVTVERWRGCDEGTVVELWTIAGWDHAWPRAQSSSDPGRIDATRRILDFFDAHQRSRPQHGKESATARRDPNSQLLPIEPLQ